MNLADLHDASVAEVAALPVSVLAACKEEYAALLARVKRIGAVLDKALEERFAKGANGPGTSHRSEDGFDVKVVIGKKVDWDADQLNDLVSDDEMLEWVDFVPKVSEARYKAAPQRIRDALAPARTEGFAKPKIDITKKKG